MRRHRPAAGLRPQQPLGPAGSTTRRARMFARARAQAADAAAVRHCHSSLRPANAGMGETADGPTTGRTAEQIENHGLGLRAADRGSRREFPGRRRRGAPVQQQRAGDAGILRDRRDRPASRREADQRRRWSGRRCRRSCGQSGRRRSRGASRPMCVAGIGPAGVQRGGLGADDQWRVSV